MSSDPEDSLPRASKQYMALQLLRELCDHTMEAVSQADDVGATLSNTEIFKRGLEQRAYAIRELISIQAMLIGSGRAVVEAITTQPAKADPWVWCTSCERCYRMSEARIAPSSYDNDYLCAYPDCNAALLRNTWTYAQVRREAHPEWPAVPRRGTRYSSYG